MDGPPVSVPADQGMAQPNPDGFTRVSLVQTDPLSRFFEYGVVVFGVRVVATSQVPEAKVIHAAKIMAEYLDNDEDGTVDDAAVIEAMLNARALLVMFADTRELETSGFFESDVIDGYWPQDLQADETNVSGRFDAALEETLHLISTAGYERVYPDAFSSRPGSLLTNAMDLARGGEFMQVPNRYPDGAWYHYYDQTCDYRCMAVEYFYWSLTTLLGAHSSPQRCRAISQEWEPCTAARLSMTDPSVYRLMTDTQYRLPTQLPDGTYRPSVQ